MGREEARKQVTKIMQEHPENVRFSAHSIRELANDNLTSNDALNVLQSPAAKIHTDGELEKGNYRYRLETTHLLIVIGFWEDGSGLNVVTAWDKRKGGTKK